MIFHGRFLTKHDGLSTDSLRRLNRSTTKRKVASDRQLVSGRLKGKGEFRLGRITLCAGLFVTMLVKMDGSLTILHVFLCVVVSVTHGQVTVDHWVRRDSRRLVCVASWSRRENEDDFKDY